MTSHHFAGLLMFFVALMFAGPATAQSSGSVDEVFTPSYRNQLVMRVEAAIAGAQADAGIIPKAAAEEIAAKAELRHAPLQDIEVEYEIVRHRMVALLNVWRRSLSEEAGNALHLGVTTVDVYDTVMILQLLEASDYLLDEMLGLEQDLACLANTHRATLMIGRTLGQHALPITFGKKVSVWLAQNGRNIERLEEVRIRLRRAGVLKGAVGSYLGLGEHGMEIERGVSERLGLDPPEPADWRAARDVFGEYAQILELMALSNASIGSEVFRLQSSDLGELFEQRPKTAVGSSTMPHKRNPSLSEALIYYGRTVPALAGIILDDVNNVAERDNTSRSNETLSEITVEAANMLHDTRRLIARLEVNPERMRANMNLTGGMILSQRIVLHLSESISREEAERRVEEAAERSLANGSDFRTALLEDPVLAPRLDEAIDDLLNPETYIGLAPQQVDAVLEWVAQRRKQMNAAAMVPCR